MKKVINVGIIGRNFGYKVIYKAIQNDKSFKVIGFSYKNKSKKNNLSNNFKVYPNWKKLVLDKKINAVIISSPPKTHKDIIKLAIKNNKHIFCEKPVTTSLKDISLICKLLNKKEICNFVNYEFTNIEAFKLFKEKYLKKIKISKIKIDWSIKIPNKKRSKWKDFHSKGGGIFYNYICHVLFYLENLFGKLSIVNSCIKKSKNNFRFESNFYIMKKKISVSFNFKTSNKLSKIKPSHKITIYTNNANYILFTKINNLYDQFYLFKNNRIIFKQKKTSKDFRIKPTSRNLIYFKNSILKKRKKFPNFNDAKRIHYLIRKIINSSKFK